MFLNLSARCRWWQWRPKLVENSSRQFDVVLGKLQSTSGEHLIEALCNESTQVLVHRIAGRCRISTHCGTDGRVMSRWKNRRYRPFRQTHTVTSRQVIGWIPTTCRTANVSINWMAMPSWPALPVRMRQISCTENWNLVAWYCSGPWRSLPGYC